jgi:ABC-type Na+ transport system ATPase subunit NatA
VSFDVAAGEFFGLLGPNGAEKTTTVGTPTTQVGPTGRRAEVGGFPTRRLCETGGAHPPVSTEHNSPFHGSEFARGLRFYFIPPRRTP